MRWLARQPTGSSTCSAAGTANPTAAERRPRRRARSPPCASCEPTVLKPSAQELLADEQQSITAIALACGFNGSEQFARVFRAATGASPSAWHQHART